MSELGREFEQLCVEIITSTFPMLIVLKERDIINIVGAHCTGIDIMTKMDNKLVFMQLKWENNCPSIRDVNHFIQSCQYANIENNEFQAYFISKFPMAQAGKLSLESNLNFSSIHSNKIDNQQLCIELIINNINTFYECNFNKDKLNQLLSEKIIKKITEKTTTEIAIENLYKQLEIDINVISNCLIPVLNTHLWMKPCEIHIHQKNIKEIYNYVKKLFTWEYSPCDCNIFNHHIRQIFNTLKHIIPIIQSINAISGKKQFKDFKFEEPTPENYLICSYFGKNAQVSKYSNIKDFKLLHKKTYAEILKAI